jgi:hypothetical protein
VFTPNPCIILNDRGIPRSDITHMTMWAAGKDKRNECESTVRVSQSRVDFTLWLQANHVPKIVVRRLALRHFIMGLRLDRVDNIREFHRFLYKENRDIVADQVPVSFLSVKFRRKATDVSNGVLLLHYTFFSAEEFRICPTYRTATRALDCAETYKHRRGT